MTRVIQVRRERFNTNKEHKKNSTRKRETGKRETRKIEVHSQVKNSLEISVEKPCYVH